MDSGDLKKIFDEFDIDKNGTISLEELGTIAQKLGSPMTSEQLLNIKDLLDTNKDGKISFSEFEYWWNKGKKGKLMNLVYLKAKAMKMTNFIKNKFTQADVNLVNHKGNTNPDKIDVSIEFGEPANDYIHFGFSFYSRGTGEKLEREKVKMLMGQLGGQINENSMGFMIKLPSKNPSEAKIAFQKLLNDTFIQEGSPIQDISQNPFFCYKSEASQKYLMLSLMVKSEIQDMAAPVTQTAEGVFGAMGQDFYGCSHVDFTINTCVDDMLDGNIAQNLMKGFSVKFYTEANQSALGRVRKLAQKTQKETPAIVNLLTLIRSKKFHLKIRSPKQLEMFMQKMGISEAVQGLPCLKDLLQEMSDGLTSEVENNPILKIVQQVSRFAMKNVENNVQIYGLLGKIGTFKLGLNAKNVTRIHSVLFNQA